MITPGPWTAVKHNDVGWDIYTEYSEYLVVGDCGVDTEENAKLIAAAPELLDASQMLLAWLAMGYKGTEPLLPKDEHTMNELTSRCLGLRSIVNKARGLE